MKINKYQEVKGDLIKLAQNGEFDVIAHGCNCFCNMGAGIAPQMAIAFDANRFPLEAHSLKGSYNKLGQIDWVKGKITKGDLYSLIVVNAYTQFGFGINHKNGIKSPLDYGALRMCLQKMNYQFSGKHIGLPQIGCGLAGGNWRKVRRMIKSELKDCKVTVVIYRR